MVSWSASDPACSFADPTVLIATVTCGVQGTYTATLTVDDGFNPPVIDTATVEATDVLFPFNWDVDASTHLKKLNQDVVVPTGNFNGSVDLTTGVLSGNITLPPAQVTLNLAGFGLVTANMQIVASQPVTGVLDPATFQVTATAVFDIRIPSAYPTLTPTLNVVGDSCTTSQPVSVTMQGIANLTGASTFAGTYTIPPLTSCGLATTALNLVVPGPGNTFSATVQPPPLAPSITTDPQSVTVVAGQAYAFSAAASGYPTPTVQWQTSTDGGATFTDLPGATAPTYSGTAAPTDTGRRFRAVFTNATGSATSAAATLHVAVPPDAPGISTVTAGPGTATVQFSPPANDGGSAVLDYTASCSASGGAPGTATGGASPLTVHGLTPGAAYTCSVSARNIAGSGPVSAPSGTVVPTSAPVVTGQPQDAAVVTGQPYSFSASASGVPAPTVRWQFSDDGGASFADIPDATDPVLTGTADLSDSGQRFRAVFANEVGSATTDAATLSVAGIAPTITSAPADTTVGVGLHYSFSASASGVPAPTVQWQTSTDGGATFTDVSGATADTLTGTATLTDSGRRFRAVYTNQEGSVTSSPATLTVSPTAVISVGSSSVMEGNTGNNRTVSLAVTLSQPAVQTITVHYATQNVTAVAPGDYTAKSGNLTFKPGKTVMYVSIPVKPDTTVEPDEMLHVVLSVPTGNSALSSAHAVGTVLIRNDDAGSGTTVSVSDAAIVEGNTGPMMAAHFLVSLSAPATSTVTVRLVLSAGSASSGADYKTFAATTVTFKAGQFQKSISVNVYPDTLHEGDETAFLTLSNPSSGLGLGHEVGTLTILDDD